MFSGEDRDMRSWFTVSLDMTIDYPSLAFAARLKHTYCLIQIQATSSAFICFKRLHLLASGQRWPASSLYLLEPGPSSQLPYCAPPIQRPAKSRQARPGSPPLDLKVGSRRRRKGAVLADGHRQLAFGGGRPSPAPAEKRRRRWKYNRGRTLLFTLAMSIVYGIDHGHMSWP